MTNNHVYEAFQSRRAASPDIMLLMSGTGGRRFLDISQIHVRGRDKDRDLAVLDIPVPHVFRQGKLFSTWDSWPPRRPEEGMPAIIYGYPGQGRVPLGDSLGIRPNTIGKYVASVSDRHFLLADVNSDAEIGTPEGATPLTSLGGMSGSAVYVMISKKELVLAGFMYESSYSMSIIYATYADHINADGTIRDFT